MSGPEGDPQTNGDVDGDDFAHPVLHVMTPFIVMGATYVLRRALTSGYAAVSGRPAPDLSDRGASLRRVLAWTAVTAVATALVEVAVVRFTDRRVGDRTV